LSYSLRITPSQHFINWQQDPHGNYLARLVFPEKTLTFDVEVDLVAELTVQNPFDFFLEPDAEHAPFTYDPSLAGDLEVFRRKDPAGPLLQSVIDAGRPKGERTVDFLVNLNTLVHDRVAYVIRMEPGVQAPEETLTLGSGSCRDSAWLLVQALRHLGYAARFVSGYLIQLVPDVKPLEGPAGATHDFTDLHAWAEVYLPGAGWVGLDATSGLLAGEGHIPLACTPEPGSAAPVTGALDEAEVEFVHEMNVTRVLETPRVTKPYTDAEWQAIAALGASVDRELNSGDVRLTMGGEPTFVSIDDPDGAEWNFDALGAKKRVLAGELVRRLHRRFSPGALLHFGQGKWYPGEQLPRWALNSYWRRDGIALWQNPSLVADDSRTYPVTSTDAERFIKTLAVRLGVNPRYSVAGYEDVYYYLWRERRLPINVNPKFSKLADEMERARLARVFEQGLGYVVGYALPLAPVTPGSGKFRSSMMFLRPDHLFLMPGDSPMGYRLPLSGLPWVEGGGADDLIERDPFEPRSPLAPRTALEPSMQRPGQGRTGASETSRWPNDGQMPSTSATERDASDPRAPLPPRSKLEPRRERQERETPPAIDESSPWVVRTCLCTEVRDGRLHVFMPPMAWLEDYVSLVEAVEATAAELDMPILVEGYQPPRDPRLESFSVTPDPGVIEVNIHPSSSWQELTHKTEVLYEEARQTRLGTEKFMLDGRHAGTGGGNHITLGGSTTPDSPFLRRPELLKSLIGYWHDHPSLSYLFSGLFIGPTSQAPRFDEARHEATYEMDIAMRRMGDRLERGYAAPPWLVDRTFRDLLADVTGNTHRTEFCIDKMYSPDGPTGRLGILELRAFEMPPHSQMSLAEQLLVRSLVARFWHKPYDAKLPRWGTELHDRFLLPHFVAQDFRDVISDMKSAGYPFERSWFDVHFEFRFPRLGSVARDSVELELRRALEPWHVLAEEAAQGGASRTVDSTLDRVQVKVRGAIPGRHAILCNGVRVPLHPTGTREEAVAGVRYKAWNLPRSLHPNVPVHAPLVFDVADLWTHRSLGGCTLHASHPGGRSYDTLPVNSYEAESRRSMLFSPLGHTPGPLQEEKLPPERSEDYPFTLDLRRYPAG
jgi:uncharacterized protein (DUF2126 family)